MMMQHILLIDDDAIVNFVHLRVIQSKFSDNPIIIFENALEALEYIRKNPMYSYLIFLDLNMPETDGWDFLEAVSLEERDLNLKIHIVTSSVDPADKIKASKNQYVLSYILKPLRLDDLKNLDSQ